MFAKLLETGLLFCLPLSSRHILEEEAEWMASFLCTSAMHLEGSSRSDVLPGGIPSPDLAKAWGDVWAKSYGSVLGQGPSRLKLFCLVQGHPDFTEDGFITIPHSYWVGIHQGTFSLKYKQWHCFKCFKCNKALWPFSPKTITSVAWKAVREGVELVIRTDAGDCATYL